MIAVEKDLVVCEKHYDSHYGGVHGLPVLPSGEGEKNSRRTCSNGFVGRIILKIMDVEQARNGTRQGRIEKIGYRLQNCSGNQNRMDML